MNFLAANFPGNERMKLAKCFAKLSPRFSLVGEFSSRGFFGISSISSIYASMTYTSHLNEAFVR